MVVLIVLCIGVDFFVLLTPYVRFHILVTEWPSIGKIAAQSAYDMFSKYKCLIINLVFFQLGF